MNPILQSRLAALTALAALATGACVTTPASIPSSARQLLSTSSRNVSREELDRFGDLPLDAALRRVRPELLRFRTMRVLLYIDRRPATGSELHDLSTSVVAAVRLLSPVEAALEYGSLYGTGAILDVRLRPIR